MSAGYDGWQNDYFDPEYDEDDCWEHAGRCPACGIDELDSCYDEKTGDTEYLCARCGYHTVTACEVQS